MPANINNITEGDFEALAFAAQGAKDRGDIVAAGTLDKLARKANAALANAKYKGLAQGALNTTPIKWTAVPSTLI